MTRHAGSAAATGDLAVVLRRVNVVRDGVHVLGDVDLAVRVGERVAVVGPSGAGKTTLLRLCRGSVAPDTGEVEVLGAPLADLDGKGLRAVRRHIGSVHQHLHLIGPLRVVHNVNAGHLATWPRWRSLLSLVRPQEVERARAALVDLGLGDRLNDRTDGLSGGEQQRVALARVLVQGPRLVLADEPIASLDPARGADVLAQLHAIVQEGRRTLLASLHDFEQARTSFDRVVGLRAGRVVFDLPARDVTAAHATSLYDMERDR